MFFKNHITPIDFYMPTHRNHTRAILVAALFISISLFSHYVHCADGTDEHTHQNNTPPANTAKAYIAELEEKAAKLRKDIATQTTELNKLMAQLETAQEQSTDFLEAQLKYFTDHIKANQNLYAQSALMYLQCVNAQREENKKQNNSGFIANFAPFIALNKGIESGFNPLPSPLIYALDAKITHEANNKIQNWLENSSWHPDIKHKTSSILNSITTATLFNSVAYTLYTAVELANQSVKLVIGRYIFDQSLPIINGQETKAYFTIADQICQMIGIKSKNTEQSDYILYTFAWILALARQTYAPLHKSKTN